MSFGELALRRIPPIYTEGMDRELLPMLRLAGPVILAEIGWMSMGVVDTIMVGPLGPAAIGAAGMSNSLFFAVAVFGMGVMLGLDALVAKSYGAGRLDDCVRWLQHGVLVALVVAPTIMLIFYGALTTSARWGLHPAVRALAQPYMAARCRCCSMRHFGDTCRECTWSGP